MQMKADQQRRQAGAVTVVDELVVLIDDIARFSRLEIARLSPNHYKDVYDQFIMDLGTDCKYERHLTTLVNV